MVMVTRNSLFTAAALLGLGGAAGCNWTVFDELADETWVDRVTKPDETNSRQYGEVVLATPTRGPGTNIVVVGRAEASISQLRYDADGFPSRWGPPKSLWQLPLLVMMITLINLVLAVALSRFDRFASRFLLAASLVVGLLTWVPVARFLW